MEKKLSIFQSIGNAIATLLLGDTKERIVRIEKDSEYIRKELDEDVKPVLRRVNERVTILWSRRVATGQSPLALNEHGKNILEYSGVKEIIEKHRGRLLEFVRSREPRNAYRVQEYSKEAVFELRDDPEILSQLEEGAYQTGEDVDTVLLVGALYLRNQILPKFSFTYTQRETKDELSSSLR